MKNFLAIFLMLAFLSTPMQTFAKTGNEKLGVFLKSAAYGTVAGAVLGLATLAWSENPSSRMSNVARGASLGLYAGIGFGLYTVYAPQKSSLDEVKYDFEPSRESPQVWFSPLGSDGRIDGWQMNWAQFAF